MCHNAKLHSGGFDLSSPEGIKEASSLGIFGKASEPEASPILRALSYENQIKMPPQGKLPPETISALREWVAAGAPSPAAAPSAGNSLAGTGVRPVALRGVITDYDKNFWSFKPLSQAEPPLSDQKGWALNAIDQFILASLEKKGLKPAPPADKTTLLRRATFDLTGLPPSEHELAAFLADKSPTPMKKWWTSFCLPPVMANAGAVTGWMSCVTPIPPAATKTTAIRTPGVIATMSSRPSMTTCPTTSLCVNNWPAIF